METCSLLPVSIIQHISCSLQYLARRKYMVTTVLDTLIKQHLREEHAERTKTHLEETRELSEYVFLRLAWLTQMSIRCFCMQRVQRGSRSLSFFSPSVQSDEECAYLCVYHGLPHRALPPACLRATLPPHDSPLHGHGHAPVWDVH